MSVRALATRKAPVWQHPCRDVVRAMVRAGARRPLSIFQQQTALAFRFSTSSYRQSDPVASKSTRTSPYHDSGALRHTLESHTPALQYGARHEARSSRSTIRGKLARIEATKGVVSPFLTDSFAREHDYLRISLTEKCNLRCTYCMPEEGAPLSPKEHLLTTDEVVKIASIFVQNGVRKIRLTGGEPTIRKDLPEIVERLSALGLHSLGMTSNGLALSRKLPSLVSAGLTHLNISLDTLDPFKFEFMTRRRGHAAVMKAIQQASELTAQPQANGKLLKQLKLNVVVINKLNDQEVMPFVEMTRDLPISIRFIEYMPFDGNKWSSTKLVPSASLLANITAASPPGTVRAISPGPSDTARIYQRDGYAGSFGFISSMTDHFCAGCSRLRLGADGSMKVCLFGEPTLSLRDLLRTGATDLELSQAIGSAVKGKKFAHDGKSGLVTISQVQALPIPDACSPSPPKGSRHRQRRIALPPRRKKSFPLAWLGSSGISSDVMASIGVRSFATSQTAKADEHKPRLTHISKETGEPTMVSITDKNSTTRSATAVGRVVIPQMAYDLLRDNESSDVTGKGDVLGVAQLAGIMGSKRTSDLIPLCHPVNLTNCQIGLTLHSRSEETQSTYYIEVKATAECTGATGVEMEALTAVSISCLTVWDMLKAVAGKEMIIEGIMVIKKAGGKSGDWARPSHNVL